MVPIIDRMRRKIHGILFDIKFFILKGKRDSLYSLLSNYHPRETVSCIIDTKNEEDPKEEGDILFPDSNDIVKFLHPLSIPIIHHV